MTEIYAALAAVMTEVDHVAKRDRNEHQRFLFRGVDAVVNAVGPALRKHKVVVVPRVEEVHYDVVATTTGKPATACRLTVAYTFYATDGSSIETVVAGEAWDAGDKATPKAMSVAFRTALLQALALPTDEPEPDASDYEREQTEPVASRRKPTSGSGEAITKNQIGLIQKLAGDLGLDRDARLAGIAKVVGRPVESSKDLTKAEASAVVDALKAAVERDQDKSNTITHPSGTVHPIGDECAECEAMRAEAGE